MNSKSKSDIKMTKGAVKASPYGWSVGLHIVTKAISAGSYLMPFIAGLFYPGLMEGPIFISGCILAIFFLIVTGILQIIGLDKPSQFASVLIRPKWDSWHTRGAIIVPLFAAGLISVMLTFRSNPSLSNTLQWPTAIMALFTAVYTAFFLAKEGSDFLKNRTIPLRMFLMPFIAASSVLLIISYPMAIVMGSGLWRSFLANVLILCIPANIMLLLIGVYIGHVTETASHTASYIRSGNAKFIFWGLSMLIGNIMPLILLLLLDIPFFIPAALVLVGLVASELLFLRAARRFDNA